jgi:hypothetical protein
MEDIDAFSAKKTDGSKTKLRQLQETASLAPSPNP